MNTHEIFGAAVSIVVIAAFVTVLISPQSQASQILGSALSNFAGVVGVASGRSAQFPGGVSVGAVQ